MRLNDFYLFLGERSKLNRQTWLKEVKNRVVDKIVMLTEFQNLLHNLDKFTCEVLNIKWKNDFKVLEFVLHFATDSFAWKTSNLYQILQERHYS